MSISLVREEKLRVLDVGSGDGPSRAALFFPNSEIHRLDGDKALKPDTVHNITKPFPLALRNRFEIVYCSHVLEHISREDVVPVLKNMAACLLVGSELWVIVPSLEWAAHQILKDNPSPVLQPFIFGSQANKWQYHKSGYTLHSLRRLTQAAGLIPRQAYQGEFTITLNEEHEYTALQNIVISAKFRDEAPGVTP